MSDLQPSILFTLFDKILEDGEVSAEELYELAEWLNANPEACEVWPGNAIVTPLQAMWSDGECKKSEIRGFVALIGRLRREWNRREKLRQKVEDELAKRAALEGAAARFDPWEAKIPTLPLQTSVRSHSKPGVTYQVDLEAQSCTCADWSGKRFRKSQMSLQRCCKHILSALDRFEPPDSWPSWLRYFTASQYPAPPNSESVIVNSGEAPVLVLLKGTDWTDVIAPQGKEYDLFGYNPKARRWSYGEAPRGAVEIKRQLDRYA